MRYLAILKDSLKEAIDTWSLLVLIALSTLVIAFVATVTFTPLPAEATMQQFFLGNNKGIPLAIVLDSHKPEKLVGHLQNARLGEYVLVNVVQVAGDTDAPDGEYQLTVAPQGFVAGNERDDNANIAAIHEIFQDAEEFGLIRVVSVEPSAKKRNEGERPQYLVTVSGTRLTHRIWACKPNILFGAIPMGEISTPLAFGVYFLAAPFIRVGEIVAALLGVIITSFFIPNMLRKGTIDLLLAKPIQRWALISYKYLGGLTFMFLATAYAIGGIWLILGIRTGVWANGSLMLIATITFFFAILYAVSTFIAVLTRSAIAAILVTIITWAVFFGTGAMYQDYNSHRIIEEAAEKRGTPIRPEDRKGDTGVAKTFYALHAITPRTGDLTYINDLIIFTDFMTGDLTNMSRFDSTKHNWVESVAISAVWIVLFIGLAALWFTYKDY